MQQELSVSVLTTTTLSLRLLAGFWQPTKYAISSKVIATKHQLISDDRVNGYHLQALDLY